jgi:hypothetical protein
MIRARHTLIYVIILAAISGYYAYFEVHKPREKQEAEQRAKKVFQFSVDQVNALEILARIKAPVRLVKEAQWRIIEPIQAEVDPASLNGVLNALETLQRDKDLTEALGDQLRAFGLQEPALVLRFKIGDGWRELAVGDLNPAGDAYYAKTGDSNTVFLMARGNWAIFDRQANELRRRQLFSFDPRAVTALDINWQGAEHILVTKDAAGIWKSTDHPDKAIKTSKVDHVLDQVHWLRAVDFLAESPQDLKPHGLDPPLVTVRLHLKEGQEVTLRLSPEDANTRRVVALASQMAGLVQVTGDALNQIPKDHRNLEDRSLVTFNSDRVVRVIWKFGGHQGHLVYSDGTQWMSQSADGKRKDLPQSWPIRSLLWTIGDAEYENRDPTASDPPPDAQGYLEFWGTDEKLGAFCWAKPSSPSGSLLSAWLLADDDAGPVAVQVKAELIGKIEQALTELNKGQSS